MFCRGSRSRWELGKEDSLGKMGRRFGGHLPFHSESIPAVANEAEHNSFRDTEATADSSASSLVSDIVEKIATLPQPGWVELPR
jgi:hypothetical protein